MSEHTKGPWIVEPVNYDGDGGTLIRSGKHPNPTCIANVWGVDNAREPDDESQANARLIAASPELLSDLKEAANLLREYEKLHRAKNTEESTIKAERNKAWAEQFEATIAKATD